MKRQSTEVFLNRAVFKDKKHMTISDVPLMFLYGENEKMISCNKTVMHIDHKPDAYIQGLSHSRVSQGFDPENYRYRDISAVMPKSHLLTSARIIPNDMYKIVRKSDHPVKDTIIKLSFRYDTITLFESMKNNIPAWEQIGQLNCPPIYGMDIILEKQILKNMLLGLRHMPSTDFRMPFSKNDTHTPILVGDESDRQVLAMRYFVRNY